jgi:fatty acid desaturase
LETVTVVLGHAAAAGLALFLYGLADGALLYACALGIPAVYAAWSMMFTNYLQHVGCDHASVDDHSRNFVSRWMNWLVFEAGYHTVHHEHAGSHWSTYPALHAARAARISPHLIERTILGYCVRRYFSSTPAVRAHVADSPRVAKAPEPACAARAPSETDCDTAEEGQLLDNYS